MNVSDCESKKFVFDQTKSMCKWKDAEEKCVYVERELTWKVIMLNVEYLVSIYC